MVYNVVEYEKFLYQMHTGNIMVTTFNIVHIRIITISLIISAFLLSTISFVLPTSPIADPEVYTGRVALMIVIAVLNIGSVILFLMGLKIFTSAFKKTYYLLCVGLIVQTIAGFSYPVATYYGQEQSSYMVMGSEFFLAIGIGIMYWGLVRFAKLLHIQTRLASPLFLGGILLILIGVLWVLPHYERADAPELVFDISRSFLLAETYIYLLASLLCYKLMRTASRVYFKSLLWVMVGNIILLGAAGLMLTHDYIELSRLVPLDVLTFPYIAAGIVTILSGYYFNTIGIMKPSATAQTEGLIDMIVFMASLASNPAEVDPLLDELRYVTATLPRNEGGEVVISGEQRDRLRQVYVKLEDYLVTREKLRSFSREDLRQLALERYGLTI